jgi:hypothetical protein
MRTSRGLFGIGLAVGLVAWAASGIAATVTVEGVFRSQLTWCNEPGCFDPVSGEPVFTETSVEVPFSRVLPVEFLPSGSFQVVEDMLPNEVRFVRGDHSLGGETGAAVDASFAGTMLSWFGQSLGPGSPGPGGFRHVWGNALMRGVHEQADGTLAGPQRVWSFSEFVHYDFDAVSFQMTATDLETPVSLADARRPWTGPELGSFLRVVPGIEVFASLDRGADGIGDHWQLRGFAQITAIEGLLPIPEPATWALWLAGLAVVARGARRLRGR